MNQLCRVCGEPAAGFHFGAFTCEGCKSFFGRTYNNLGSISECKNNGECVINKKNRTSCKACRLRKCFLVGMSKSGSRYGRRSNWFKIHCLLQEQQQQQQQQTPGAAPALAKNKLLQMWNENPPRHLMDSDNNNTPLANASKQFPYKNGTLSPSPVLPARTLPASSTPSYSPDTTAALWAARNALLPLHPMNPAGLHLPIPFLTSSFLHTTFPPQPSRNMILPFMHSIVPPKLHSERLPLPTAVSHSSSSSPVSSTPPASPVRESNHFADFNSHAFPGMSNYSKIIDRSIAVLHALGPMQDSPIDLSFKRRDSAASKLCSDDSAGGKAEGESDCDHTSDDGRSEESRRDDAEALHESGERQKKVRTTPLDLTTKS